MTNSIKRETIVLVYDRNGRFYKWFINIDTGINVANTIKGSYKVISDD